MTRLTPEEWLRMQKPVKRHKYGAKRTVIDGESFPSALEARVYSHHSWLEDCGAITELTRKATVRFDALDITYKADMKYEDKLRGTVWVEAKGMETDRWRIIKKIWVVMGLGPLEVYKANSRGIYLAETITPKTAVYKKGEE